MRGPGCLRLTVDVRTEETLKIERYEMVEGVEEGWTRSIPTKSVGERPSNKYSKYLLLYYPLTSDAIIPVPPVLQSKDMLCLLPHDILLRIALELALTDPTSNPKHLISLLQTCRYVHRALSKSSNHDLYANIFKEKFDTSAPLRRFGAPALYSSNLTDQLVRYCRVLKHIRRADIYSPTILEDFWMAFIMMTENDGRNERQLAAAGLADYVEHFVLERLWERREFTNQWPAESTINALALWLMWFTTDLGMFHSSFTNRFPHSSCRLRTANGRVQRRGRGKGRG